MGYTRLPQISGGGGSTSDDITNLSTTPGATVTDALDNTNTTVNNIVNVQLTTQYVPETFVLTNTDITNKYIVLAEAPETKEITQMLIIGGITGEYSVDFVITNDNGGKRLSWDGLGFQSLLSAGESIVVLHN